MEAGFEAKARWDRLDSRESYRQRLEKKNMSREEVYALLNGEREYQDKVWPPPTSEKKTPTDFAVYMHTYLQAGMEHVSRNPSYAGLLENIRKVTALGVACMELFDTPARSEEDIRKASSRRKN